MWQPCPECALPTKADRMPMAAHRPEVRSATGRPGLTGPPPRSPVRLMMPPIAWNTVSYPLRGAYGPVMPKPVHEK
ncbi:hypothetical protein G6F22_021358 [Rhizopus arrhizus]|nr:hypothetical protein G6F22_021358 [Rhizopus arrhizus]KAG1372022.1 hypothetical protein G6F60_015622 [Rhizopus arrhizus]